MNVLRTEKNKPQFSIHVISFLRQLAAITDLRFSGYVCTAPLDLDFFFIVPCHLGLNQIERGTSVNK